ncbi:two-component system, OmpR family, catabolic regulation response regulator CreB [Janthinobacterium sp. OK676]|uniref:two-component system response regulator CreB n=1 Tax=unclassified Janthinobacterium TaxID=2610881 RepID=UPI0008921C9D|nr:MULTISPECIES: two-component system response regulator CreB [unclassified Janthinobacterium]PJJ20872.1 winged helix family two component transcriptional regulator [Janthinobacterium sp. 67]SDN98902.1 two-component system, OmpR family, catabolic regulation response regulator CreB [Janthinobacterium sp. OK676]
MSKTVLIVEDEQAIADSIAYALRTDGFTPRHVMLGEQALDALRPIPGEAAPMPVLVVLDVGLPDMSGLEVCRRLRQFSEIPVIFLTARSDEIDRIVGLEIGADDYVTKPFSPRELVARIRVILRRAGVAQAPRETGMTIAAPVAPAAPARFELRALEAKVLFHGRPLDLTRYEYLLLKTLLEHPGHVLSRAQLMERVWSGAPDTLERTVDAHVKSLRAKLRAVDAQADPIHTHRGLGYSLAGA